MLQAAILQHVFAQLFCSQHSGHMLQQVEMDDERMMQHPPFPTGFLSPEERTPPSPARTAARAIV